MKKTKVIATLVATLALSVGAVGFTACGEDTTPSIGANGNWYIGETDTGVNASGIKGDKGDKGDTGADGATGAAGKDGVDGKDGKDGVDGKDGQDGKDGADGKDGQDGKDGADGKDGLDAYEAAIKAGVITTDDYATAEDFYASLKTAADNACDHNWSYWATTKVVYDPAQLGQDDQEWYEADLYRCDECGVLKANPHVHNLVVNLPDNFADSVSIHDQNVSTNGITVTCATVGNDADHLCLTPTNSTAKYVVDTNKTVLPTCDADGILYASITVNVKYVTELGKEYEDMLTADFTKVLPALGHTFEFVDDSNPKNNKQSEWYINVDKNGVKIECLSSEWYVWEDDAKGVHTYHTDDKDYTAPIYTADILLVNNNDNYADKDGNYSIKDAFKSEWKIVDAAGLQGNKYYDADSGEIKDGDTIPANRAMDCSGDGYVTVQYIAQDVITDIYGKTTSYDNETRPALYYTYKIESIGHSYAWFTAEGEEVSQANPVKYDGNALTLTLKCTYSNCAHNDEIKDLVTLEIPADKSEAEVKALLETAFKTASKVSKIDEKDQTCLTDGYATFCAAANTEMLNSDYKTSNVKYQMNDLYVTYVRSAYCVADIAWMVTDTTASYTCKCSSHEVTFPTQAVVGKNADGVWTVYTDANKTKVDTDWVYSETASTKPNYRHDGEVVFEYVGAESTHTNVVLYSNAEVPADGTNDAYVPEDRTFVDPMLKGEWGEWTKSQNNYSWIRYCYDGGKLVDFEVAYDNNGVPYTYIKGTDDDKKVGTATKADGSGADAIYGNPVTDENGNVVAPKKV